VQQCLRALALTRAGIKGETEGAGDRRRLKNGAHHTTGWDLLDRAAHLDDGKFMPLPRS